MSLSLSAHLPMGQDETKTLHLWSQTKDHHNDYPEILVDYTN
jgi:hypothetical protein